MDLTQLKNKPSGPIIGGGFNSVMFALKEWLLDEDVPERDAGNKAVISNDIVFKDGYGWEFLYATRKKIKLTDEGNDLPDNDARSTNLQLYFPGIAEYFDQFVSEYGNKDFFLLVSKQGLTYPLLVGRKGGPAYMVEKYESGESAGDEDGSTINFMSEGAYKVAHYKGAVTNGESIIAADDDTPDVSSGTRFITSENVAATEITDLDNPVVGSEIYIFGGGGVNASVINDGANFSLAGGVAWTANAGAWIKLYVRADNDYVELERG